MQRRLTACLPFLIAAIVYVGIAVRTDPPFQGDQPHYALEAFSIAHDADRDLTNQYGDIATVRRVWGQDTLLPHAYRYTPDGPLVSFHAPGLPLLLAPAAAVSDERKALQVEVALIAALGAQLLFGLLAKLAPDRRRWCWAVWASVVFALPLLGYADALFPDVPAAVATLAVVRLLVEPRLGRWGILGAATLAAALPWLHIRFWAIGVVLLLALALRVVGWRRGAGAATLARGLALVVAPLLVSVAVMALANEAWYGSPSPTAAQHAPVHQLAASSAGGAPAAQSESGFKLVDAVSPAPVYLGLGRSLFSARSGWLPFVPVAVLGVAALIALALRGDRWALFGLFGALAYLIEVASTGALPGYAAPGRFELVLAPLVAVPLLLAVVRLPWVRVAFVPLAVLGVAVGLSGVAHAGNLFPPADATAKPTFGGSKLLLAPWPTVTRTQPPPPSAITVPATAPAQLLGSGDYVVVATLGRAGGTAPADARAATLRVLIDGVPVTSGDVLVGELPTDGRVRGFPLDFRLAPKQAARIVVVPTGAIALHRGPVQYSATIGADSGLLQSGSRFPDRDSVLAWASAILALAAVMALTLPPRLRLWSNAALGRRRNTA